MENQNARKGFKVFSIIAAVVLFLAIAAGIVILLVGPSYKVNYYTRDVSGDWGIYKTVDVKGGQTIENNKPDNPSRTAYTFMGWYKDRALTQVYDEQTKVQEDLNLYARFVFTNLIEVPAAQILTYDPLLLSRTPNIPQNDNYSITYYEDAGLTQEIFGASLAGRYYVKLQITNNNFRWDNGTEDGTTEDQVVTWFIEKAERENALTLHSWSIGDTPNTPDVGAIAEAFSGVIVEYYHSVSSSGPYLPITLVQIGQLSAVGAHYIYAVIAESPNYQRYTTNVVQFYIASAGAIHAPDPALLTLPYNGSLQLPLLDELYYEVLYKEASKRRDAGSNYEITLGLREGYEWYDGTTGFKVFNL